MKFFRTLFKYVITLTVFLSFFTAQASVSNGTVDGTNHSALLCKNYDCTISSQINFKATVNNPNPVYITDTTIIGDVWSEDMGWIRLNPNGGYGGIINDGNGNLSGYAFGNEAGWISFNCANEVVNNCATNGNFKVSINSSGEFGGYAWSENYGWIKFDCSVVGACVKTDWRPFNTRPRSGSSGSYLPPTSPIVVAPIVVVPNVPISVSIVKKPTVKTPPVQQNIVEPQINIDENNFINTEPKEPPKIKTPNINNLKKATTPPTFLGTINDFFIDIINAIKDNIFSRYFMGISLFFNIFNYSGYINPFWIGISIIILLFFIYFLYKRRRDKKRKVSEMQ